MQLPPHVLNSKEFKQATALDWGEINPFVIDHNQAFQPHALGEESKAIPCESMDGRNAYPIKRMGLHIRNSGMWVSGISPNNAVASPLQNIEIASHLASHAYLQYFSPGELIRL